MISRAPRRTRLRAEVRNAVAATLDARQVAGLLAEMGQRTLLAGGNSHRARAYSKAADSLLALTGPLGAIVAQHTLREIPGIGEGLSDIITKLHHTGTHPTLERMRSEIPAGVLELLTVPGLRAEKVVKLYQVLGIRSLADLEEATRVGRLENAKGFGAALQRKILAGLDISRRTPGALHIHRAADMLRVAENDLRKSEPEVTHVAAAGDFRRSCELVSDLVLIAQTTGLEEGPRVIRTGNISVHFTDEKRFGAALLLATGSKAHVDELQSLAGTKGLTLTADGVRSGGTTIASRTEADIYRSLGLQFVEPELREGRGEISLALKKRLPVLVRDGDIRGIVHAHTTASDGADTLANMAEATRERGYFYFGVADHSRSARYVGGLSAEDIERQHRQIDRLNVGYFGKFHIFKGIESDILPDGALDYPENVLQKFDFVVASVHSHFRMERMAQTERIVKAVSNPRTTVLGHMTGRQLLRRDGYDFDIETVLAACSEHGVAVEINSHPWRLDLDWRWHQLALELGCRFSINPDAHSVSQIDLTRWGVAMARKGGVPKDRVINCLDRRGFARFLNQRRSLCAV